MLPLLVWLALSAFGAQLELLPEERAELAGRPATTAFLKARAERLVAAWRADPGKADRKQALLLYWYRGPLLSEADRAFLKSLNPVELGKAPSLPQDSGRVPVGGGPPRPAVASAGADLLDRLKGQLELLDHGSPQQAAELGLALERMLESPFARQLAEELVRHKTKVRVSFEPLDSALVESEGRKVLTGTHGEMVSGDVPHVKLASDYLAADAGYRAGALPVTLGHELLGHALEHVKAKRARVDDTYFHYELNETNARLVGWIIEAERGSGWGDDLDEVYLRDPEDYEARLKLMSKSYAAKLDLDGLSDPAGALKETLALVRSEYDKVRARLIAPYEEYKRAAEHFVAGHGLTRAALRPAFAEIERRLNAGREELARVVAIRVYVEERLAWYATPEGRQAAAELKKDAAHPYFLGRARDIAERTERLEKLAAKPQPAVLTLEGMTVTARRDSTPPPAPAVIGWGDFLVLLDEDREAHPEHFKEP